MISPPFETHPNVLTPDNKPDYAVSSPMADEIPLANVIRVECHGSWWMATIGPRPHGLTADGATWESAVRRLVTRAELMRWPVDETWQDRME
jgi:hypothetical protein